MRVLFCGLGGIGQRHLRNLRFILGDDLDVHAFRVRRQMHKLHDNLSIEPEANVEIDYSIVVHTSLHQAIAIKPDAVFVCNPSSLHTQVALAAAKAGAHIFIEKPVANSMDGLDELLEIVSSNKLVCYVGYNFRFHPGLMRLKSLVEEQYFGNIVSVKAEIGEYLPNWHIYEDYRDMYAARKDLGGGVILSQIHEMDLIYWYFGLPDTIICRGGKLSNLDIDVEDTATSLMQYDGMYGRFPIILHQDFIQRPPTRTFKIAGDKGVAKIDLIQQMLHIYNHHGELKEALDYSSFQRNNMFLQQTEHFIECIRKKEKPQADLYTGIQSLRLALAAKKSLATGKEIKLSGELIL